MTLPARVRLADGSVGTVRLASSVASEVWIRNAQRVASEHLSLMAEALPRSLETVRVQFARGDHDVARWLVAEVGGGVWGAGTWSEAPRRSPPTRPSSASR